MRDADEATSQRATEQDAAGCNAGRTTNQRFFAKYARSKERPVRQPTKENEEKIRKDREKGKCTSMVKEILDAFAAANLKVVCQPKVITGLKA